MQRPQLTLTMLLGLVAWALSAMPAPQARAAADAQDLIVARACGWLDVEDRALNGGARGDERAEMSASSRTNTLRFRVTTPPLPAAAPPRPARQSAASAPCAAREALLRFRDTAELPPADAAGQIVWLVPMPSRWAQRPTVDRVQQLALAVAWNWGLPSRAAQSPVAPTLAEASASVGIGRQAHETANAWWGDRCPILMRVRPAPSTARLSSPPATSREAAATLAGAMSVLSRVLRDWSARLEQAALEAPRTPAAESRPSEPQQALDDWTSSGASLMILGL